ncbi:flagellar hook-associated protein FlgK [Shimia thalassica]|uniref:flagellar hook-associated protein FlgK n=1 Tax=Shimia thalassica TaxID=1715693 RepID=UPI0026E12953|nr:flagellar hook-associated protein FlgK [Shimia thalassica]MDO6479799.1 flagellar hook-associated protein FlgK [Shimia thalassica]
MSISSALSNALGGLAVSSKRAELVSANVANVSTDGYARRELSLEATSYSTQGGVRVSGVTRHVNEQTLSERRLAGAAQAHSSALLTHQSRMETLVGDPTDASSLSARLADFEASIDAAVSRPDLLNRLEDVAYSAAQVVSKISGMSQSAQDARQDADTQVAGLVESLENNLKNVEELNRLIIAAEVNNRDASSLFDQRQKLVDDISEIVPVHQMKRDFGEIALVSVGGAVLLDGSAVDLSFSGTPTIVPHMTVENGLLSQVLMNDRPAAATLSGGALEAQLTIRDELTVDFQEQLDVIALDLSLRFQNPDVDQSIGPDDPAIFTDSGARVDETALVGLSGRLAINDLLSHEGAFDVSRLRSGLGAEFNGDAGDNSLLSKMKEALNEASTLPSGSGQSLFEMGSAFETHVASDRLRLEESHSFQSARFAQLKENELADGVDTDVEMQNLLLIEQSFAANARVIQTIDDLMNTLLRM